MKHDEVTTKLLVSDAHGIHIPSIFASTVSNVCDTEGEELKGEMLVDMSLIKNPDNEMYWEAWDNVLENVYVYEEANNSMGFELYSLHHNGDLWAIKVDDLDKLNSRETERFWENFNS